MMYAVVRSMDDFIDCLGVYDNFERAVGKAYVQAFNDSEDVEPKERIERITYNDGYGDQWTFRIVGDEDGDWHESIHVLKVRSK